jgi:predicted phosphodiesterase
MKYAIFSDVHNNLEGLQVALTEAERAGAQGLLCCGDIIGYNADAAACVDLVLEKRVRSIRGNHERGLEELRNGIEPNMNPVAMAALLYTREALSKTQIDWLISLPDKALVDGFFYVFHGSPSDPDEYIFDTFEAAYAFKSLAYDYAPPANLLCFIGHTHVCAAYEYDTEQKRVTEKKIENGQAIRLASGKNYMFNVGSCGQYRGGRPFSTLCLLDGDAMIVEFRFLEYDYTLSQEKIVAAGLPTFLADRLAMGQ